MDNRSKPTIPNAALLAIGEIREPELRPWLRQRGFRFRNTASLARIPPRKPQPRRQRQMRADGQRRVNVTKLEARRRRMWSPNLPGEILTLLRGQRESRRCPERRKSRRQKSETPQCVRHLRGFNGEGPHGLQPSKQMVPKYFPDCKGLYAQFRCLSSLLGVAIGVGTPMPCLFGSEGLACADK